MGIHTILQTGRQQIPSRRIGWIDIAKGIAILLVIIGHTVKFGGGTRNFIFSFHMPLFFILTGYTSNLAADWDTVWRHAKKNFKHLILPVLLVSCISIGFQWVQSGDLSNVMLWKLTRNMGDALYWASGVNVKHHPGAGMVWFLISLFWGKLILDGINVLFSSKDNTPIYTMLGLFGMALGIKGKWLPQNFDVTLVVVFFLAIGVLWKKYHTLLEKHETLLFLGAVVYWITCLKFNLYIELATRSYPYWAISIVEAVAGSYAFCCFCKNLEGNLLFDLPFQHLGKHTLLILLIHHLDWFGLPLWQNPVMWKSIILRSGVDLIFAALVYVVGKSCHHLALICYNR